MMSNVSPFFINSAGTFSNQTSNPGWINFNLKNFRGPLPLWHLNPNKGTQELSEKCLSNELCEGALPVEIGKVVGHALSQTRLKKCKRGRQVVRHLFWFDI